MSQAVESLPKYLHHYVDEQKWEEYTPRDHAVWRFILKQNIAFFGEQNHAVKEYQQGLKNTAVSLSEIPKISEMDKALDPYGWGAVPVCGFIPPIAFLEFQSYGVLPIATHMRRVEHISYTPAPDIVHESAGHAPILVNEEYSLFLKKYASVAKKAINSKHNIQVYEAVRLLSDIKELEGISQDEIKKANNALLELKKIKKPICEVAKAVRLYWWTAEYGLLGAMHDPKVYGAGLLSSIGESQHCLQKSVLKIPLSLDCINYDYDITAPQPQLFVAKKFEDLLDTLHELEKSLSHSKGGAYGLQQALDAESVTTIQYANRFNFCGMLMKVIKGIINVPVLVYQGKVQSSDEEKRVTTIDGTHQFSVLISDEKKVLIGDGRQYRDLIIGEQIRIKSGNLVIEGVVEKATDRFIMLGRNKGLKELLGSSTPEDKVYIVFSNDIVSVTGGPLEQSSYGDYFVGAASTTPYSSQIRKNLPVQGVYQRIHQCQKEVDSECGQLMSFLEECKANFPNEWLLFIEIFEMLTLKSKRNMQVAPILSHFKELMLEVKGRLQGEDLFWYQKGIELVSKK